MAKNRKVTQLKLATGSSVIKEEDESVNDTSSTTSSSNSTSQASSTAENQSKAVHHSVQQHHNCTVSWTLHANFVSFFCHIYAGVIFWNCACFDQIRLINLLVDFTLPWWLTSQTGYIQFYSPNSLMNLVQVKQPLTPWWTTRGALLQETLGSSVHSPLLSSLFEAFLFPLC